MITKLEVKLNLLSLICILPMSLLSEKCFLMLLNGCTILSSCMYWNGFNQPLITGYFCYFHIVTILHITKIKLVQKCWSAYLIISLGWILTSGIMFKWHLLSIGCLCLYLRLLMHMARLLLRKSGQFGEAVRSGFRCMRWSGQTYLGVGSRGTNGTQFLKLAVQQSLDTLPLPPSHCFLQKLVAMFKFL